MESIAAANAGTSRAAQSLVSYLALEIEGFVLDCAKIFFDRAAMVQERLKTRRKIRFHDACCRQLKSKRKRYARMQYL